MITCVRPPLFLDLNPIEPVWDWMEHLERYYPERIDTPTAQAGSSRLVARCPG